MSVDMAFSLGLATGVVLVFSVQIVTYFLIIRKLP